MGLLDKEITYEMYEHCQSCSIYQDQLDTLIYQQAMNQVENPEMDYTKITPRCLWFIEHVLNGNEVNTKNCIWYHNDGLPYLMKQ